MRELIHAFRLEELLRHTECKTVQLFWRTRIYRKSVVFCEGELGRLCSVLLRQGEQENGGER